MKQTFFALTACLLVAACGNNTTTTTNTSADTTGNAAKARETATTESAAPASTATASANDPAIAVIQNNRVRFKLHRLEAVTPAADAPVKPASGKTVYAADISAEYLEANNKSVAEYMLSSYIIDDKGNKLSLPMGSTRLAMLVSSSQAEQDNKAGESFNQSNAAKGQVFRRRQYGVEMESGNKPVKWGMLLDGKEMEVAINQ